MEVTMGLVYKQLTKQITANKIFVTLLLLLTILTSLSFFFVKFSIDGNMEMLNSLTSLTENQKLYQAALNSNTSLANMFFLSLTSLTAFVFVMFFYRFFRENRKQIGCLKSLGYKDSFLQCYFVVFTATVSVIGSLFGLVGGYFLSDILIQANIRTYAVTGLIKGVNALSFFIGVIVATTIFCLVTFFIYSLVKGKEVGVLLAGKQTKKKISHTFKVANRIAGLLPVKNQFPLRIALRKPVAVFMILVAVMAFNVCMMLGYSLNISSKNVFASQTMGHNYEYMPFGTNIIVIFIVFFIYITTIPIMSATIKEKKNANIFRRIEIFLPKYLISTGSVIIPTIIRVETKVAICMYPAPFSKRRAAVGNATKPGIKVTEPIMAASITPNHPDSEPIILEIVSGLRIASRKPTNKITTRNSGRIFSNAFHAFFSAIFVFFLSFRKERISRTIASP